MRLGKPGEGTRWEKRDGWADSASFKSKLKMDPGADFMDDMECMTCTKRMDSMKHDDFKRNFEGDSSHKFEGGQHVHLWELHL